MNITDCQQASFCGLEMSERKVLAAFVTTLVATLDLYRDLLDELA